MQSDLATALLLPDNEDFNSTHEPQPGSWTCLDPKHERIKTERSATLVARHGTRGPKRIQSASIYSADQFLAAGGPGVGGPGVG